MTTFLPITPAPRPLAVARAPWERQRVPSWTHPLALRVFMLAVFLIPLQINAPGLESVVDTRLSPTDILLAISVMMAPSSLRIIGQPVAYVALGLPLVLGYGVVMALVVQGEITNHSIFVKLMGAMVLVVLGLVTMALTREGHGPRILRTYLLGVVVSAILGYIDWRVANIMPWVGHRNDSRFVALVADPNNAGALFGTTAVLALRGGRQLFKRTASWVAVVAILGFALTQTLSRGAFIGTAFALLTLLAVDRISAERWTKLALGALLAAGAVLASGFAESAIDDFSRRPDNVGDRENLIEGALELWTHSRGLGAGLGTVRLVGGEIVHNTGVWLVTEMSLPGLIYLLCVLAIPVGACLRLRSINEPLAMGLLGAHVVMSVAAVGIEALYQRGWWVIIGCMVFPATQSSLRRERRTARR